MEIEQHLKRQNELREQGYGFIQAGGIAQIEERIRDWPGKWGDNLEILIYFDNHQELKSDLVFDDLGITICKENRKGTVIRGPLSVHTAIVKVEEKSLDAVHDAISRINILLGVWTLVEWGNNAVGWWCHIIHGSTGGVIAKIDPEQVNRAIQSVSKIPIEARRKVDAALYWIRANKNMLMQHYQSDTLLVYANYWNAFECLVDAICKIRPMPKLRKDLKRKSILVFILKRLPNLQPSDIEDCYRTFVNPGFVAKASHALGTVFGEDGKHYIEECFRKSPRRDRLYDIRKCPCCTLVAEVARRHEGNQYFGISSEVRGFSFIIRWPCLLAVYPCRADRKSALVDRRSPKP